MALSEEQNRAIEKPVDNKLILAGPGTGKSFTIMYYVKYLIETKNVNPKNIYVITFTRAATKELRENLKKEVGNDYEIPHVFTLHGFSLRQLVRNASKVKTLPTNFNIADDYEERSIIEEDLKRYLKIEIREVYRLFNLLSSNWETLNADTKEWEITFESPEFLGLWKQHREVYGYALRSELVYQFKKLLEQGTDLKIDAPIENLIVDEYQDLNRCDLSIIKYINDNGAKLFVAGDDDQSIYAFRYAYPEGIRNFTKEINNSEQFLVTECRRCDSTILDLALNVVRQDHQRIPKTLKSVTGLNGKVALLRFTYQIEEANNIARLIHSLNEKGTNYNNIIILMRSDLNRSFSKPIVDALTSSGIPINFRTNKLSVFNEEAGRYFLGLLKYLVDKQNNLALRTILQLTKSVGNKTIDSIYNKATEKVVRFDQVLELIRKGEIKLESGNNIITDTLNRIDIVKSTVEESDSVKEKMKIILEAVPFETNNLNKILNELIIDYNIESIEQIPMLISETSFFGEPPEKEEDGVRIMTMHQAKGLTADAVFVVASEDEYIPGKNEINEERRLLYVSLTRAKHYLFITYCIQRSGQQQFSGFLRYPTKRRNLTRFLTDIPTLIPVSGSTFQI